MDISNDYIEMCRYPDIQKQWDQRNGDFFWRQGELCLLHKHKTVQYGSENPWLKPSGIQISDGWEIEVDHKSIWLPLQDQLQDMVDWKKYDISISYYSMPWVFEWRGNQPKVYGVNGNSMEQLWLLFVMKERYNKEWTG